jgi:hypothetical protein
MSVLRNRLPAHLPGAKQDKSFFRCHCFTVLSRKYIAGKFDLAKMYQLFLDKGI